LPEQRSHPVFNFLKGYFKMKLKLAAASVALAFAGQAYAVGPTITPDLTLYVGGGAEQNNVFETIAASLFTPGTIDYYTDDTATPAAKGKSFRAVYGKLAAAAGSLPAGSNVLVVYRSLGGVFANGIGPLVRGQTLPYYKVIGNASLISTGGNPSYKITNLGLTDPKAPDIGLANEELTLFSGLNLPAGTSAISPAELSHVTSQPLYAVVNGIAVTNNLATLRPNGFSKAEIAAILSGSYAQWSQVDPGLSSLGEIVLIDRNFGSGAKAAANQYFLNAPGGLAFGGTVDPVNLNGDIGDPVNYSQYTIRTEPSAGNVPGVLDGVYAKGKAAIGILSLENLPTGSSHWQFTSIDGASVGTTTFNKAQAISGRYDYFYQASFNTRNSAVNGQRYNQSGTAWGAVINAFKNKALDPSVITAVPGTILDPVTFPSTGNATLDAFRAKGTRFGNSTAPLQLVE
jgi:hypothetical protein